MYGRAAGIFPRTLEAFDQYDLLQKLTQVGFVGTLPVNYNEDGIRDNTNGPMRQVLESAHGHSFLDFMLSLRLKYTEEIIQREYERIGGRIRQGWELVKIDDKTRSRIDSDCDSYPVEIGIEHVKSGETKMLRG
jgi:hypothetical protein